MVIVWENRKRELDLVANANHKAEPEFRCVCHRGWDGGQKTWAPIFGLGSHVSSIIIHCFVSQTTKPLRPWERKPERLAQRKTGSGCFSKREKEKTPTFCVNLAPGWRWPKSFVWSATSSVGASLWAREAWRAIDLTFRFDQWCNIALIVTAVCLFCNLEMGEWRTVAAAATTTTMVTSQPSESVFGQLDELTRCDFLCSHRTCSLRVRWMMLASARLLMN